MKIKAALIILLIFSLPVFTAAANNRAESVHILEMTNQGIVLEFQLHDLSVDTVKYGSDKYLNIDFPDAVFNANAGAPLLPLKRKIIGIPLHSKIEYVVESSDYYEMSGMIAPQSTPHRKNDFIHYIVEQDDSLYNLSQLVPEDVVNIGPPEFIRNQQVVEILFNPVQFNPVQKKIKINRKITVRIDFRDGTIVATGPSNDVAEDPFVNALVINHQQSAKWQRKRVPGALRKSNTIDNLHKIFIKDEGMYKLTGSTLLSYGIDIKAIDTATLKIYNNGGRELSRNILSSPPDSLIENAIVLSDGGDAVFDVSDYIIFYGKSINNWEYDTDTQSYSHYLNHYDEYNVYWLGWGSGLSGKRMELIDGTDNSALVSESYFYDAYYFEQEINNFLGSGYEWFSRLFIPNDDYGFTSNLPNALSESSTFKFRFVGWENSQHAFSVTVNGKPLGDFVTYGKGQFKTEKTENGLLNPGYNSLRIRYTGNLETSQAYLDWFEIHYRRSFIADENYLRFYTVPSDAEKRFTISGFESNDIFIYDITDEQNLKQVTKISTSDNSASFVNRTDTDLARRFVALASNAFKIPENIEPETLIGLRDITNGAEYIIITHDDFYESVQTYAQHRESRDNMNTMVVNISDVYNEFSWGLVDPGAIRDFIKYAFHHWTTAPAYILLWGDGDYDYKNVINDQDKNWIPTYQTSEINEYDSRTIEDWFVFVSGVDSKADLAIGRIPVRSVEESEIVVKKIIDYETVNFFVENPDSRIDDWRNTITMVSDDELIGGGVGEETIHTKDAERIIEPNRYVPNRFNKKKIYLTEYPALRNASYFSAILKPLAGDAIIDQINQGTLILNYVGHGNPTTWSHEYVLYAPRDFDKIQNGKKYSFWVAATCDFGRFDDPDQQGLAEELIVAENRGAIGILASTRVAYAQNNAALNRSFYLALFDDERPTERLGMALLKAKIDNGSGTNDQKYILLGDPTMRLAAPEFESEITSIAPDTIKALSRISVKGLIKKDNVKWSDFKGKILLKAYDSKKDRDYTTQAESPINYKLPGNTIFRGAGKVENGEFDVSFIVPKDITYGGSLGRVNTYFVNEDVSGTGYMDSLMVGGTSAIVDEEGPEVQIGFQGQNFFNEGFTNERPVLKVDISDSLSGINIVGDIGHNITLILDEDEENKVILTDYFQYHEDSYTSGSILFDLAEHIKGDLEQWEHHLEIKAWDNSNNSSVAEADFRVVSSSDLEIRSVLNYPNPFISTTTFTFLTNHTCNSSIKIYTLAGRLIHEIEGIHLQVNELASIDWNGRDKDGDALANGVYFYKVIAKAEIDGKSLTAEKIQKLVIVR